MNRKPSIAIIFVTVLIDLIGFGIIIPLLPFYALSFQASAFEVTIISSLFSLFQFIMAPFWGSLSDKFGRRPILLISIFGNFFAYLLFAYADSLWMIYLARAVSGGFSANIGAAQAYIADITTSENRSRGMGLIGAAFGLGFILGPSIGGLLAPFGYEVPGLAAAGLSLANGMFAIFFLKESFPREKRQPDKQRSMHPQLFKNIEVIKQYPLAGQLILMNFLLITGFSMFEVTFALLMENNFSYTAREVGYLFTFVGIIIAIVQGLLIGPATRTIGEKWMILSGLTVTAIFFNLFPVFEAGQLTGLLVVSGIFAAGSAFVNPSISGLVSNSVGDHEQGKVMGVFQGFSSLSRIVGPIWGGFAFGQLHYSAPFISASLLSLICLFWVVSIFKTYRGQIDSARQRKATE